MRKLENQKEVIFNTAKDILTGDDVKKFSIRMISSRCNIGMGTIYKYYGNKDDIILDITRDLWMSYINEINRCKLDFVTLFDYIEYLYEKLKEYSKKFNYTVLSKELSNSFREEGKQEHRKAQEIYVSMIGDKINMYYDIESDKVLMFSDFIANNLISMITNKDYKFDVFNYVLKDLFKNCEEKQ